jgi:hypothetical protein
MSVHLVEHYLPYPVNRNTNVFYWAYDGSVPVQEFLLEHLDLLDSFALIIERIIVNGLEMVPYKKLTGFGNLYEIRDRQVRYFFFRWNKSIVFTEVYIKKTDKTDVRVMQRAEKRRIEFEEGN